MATETCWKGDMFRDRESEGSGVRGTGCVGCHSCNKKINFKTQFVLHKSSWSLAGLFYGIVVTVRRFPSSFLFSSQMGSVSLILAKEMYTFCFSSLYIASRLLFCFIAKRAEVISLSFASFRFKIFLSNFCFHFTNKLKWTVSLSKNFNSSELFIFRTFLILNLSKSKPF